MPTKIDNLIEALRTLPPDADYDDAIEEIIYLSKVERGLRQAEAGQTLSLEEVKARLSLSKRNSDSLPSRQMTLPRYEATSPKIASNMLMKS